MGDDLDSKLPAATRAEGPRRSGVVGGIIAVTLLASLGAAPPTLRTIGVDEVHAGMRGYGLSVFSGTKPERFNVEVIGVLHNFRPDQDLVLIKTPHPLLDHAGSVAGMSGSPVFLDDRMLGAYAYGWNFGKDPIAGVTPIANMLAELHRPSRPGAFPWQSPVPERAKGQARPAPREAFLGRERRDAFFALTHLGPERTRSTAQLVPAATPLIVGGMTPAVVKALSDHFAPLGLEVIEAGGAGGSSQDGGPTAFENGSSIAVQLLRGDVQATGVGTVTYVDGTRAVAFGHPMLDAGEVALPTATSRVLHVLASERSSFKMAEALRPLGALVHDRQSAIVVDADAKPHTVQITLRIHGPKGLPRDTWHAEALDHRLLTPSLVLSAISSGLGAAINDHTDMMFRATSVVTLREQGPQRVVDEGFSSSGVSQMGALANLRLFDILEAAYGNPFGEAVVERVEVDIDTRFGREVTELLGAQLSVDELNPGDTAHILLTLRPYAGPIEQRAIEIAIPENWAGETIELEIAPGASVHVERPLPTSLADILEAVKSGYPSTSLVVSQHRKGRGLSLLGQVVRNLPGSALDTLSPAHDTGRGAAFATQTRLAIPMGRVMTGSAKLTLTVRKEKL